MAFSLGESHARGQVLAVPFCSEVGEVMGCLLVAYLVPNKTFPEESREVLLIVAGYISASIQKLRKEQSLRQSEQKALEVVADLQRTEQQLVQSQKMESIGRLAGGVAHDFNNLLTPIMGYAHVGAAQLPAGHRLRFHFEEIKGTAERAANLTRQLLAFARRQVIEPKVISLNDLITDMDSMLRRLIGEDIELVTRPSPDLGLVKADPGQIEQVLLNLVVNARDVLPSGGKISIETGNEVLDSRYAEGRPEVLPGCHVVLSVRDDGPGMPPEIKDHIFEPFFTTKEATKGTGLGLATCYGIITQSGGHIDVCSEPGQGTSMKIYLPQVEETAPMKNGHTEYSELPGGAETVLLAEDEPAVRSLAAYILRDHGYKVLEAGNGVEALSVAREHAAEAIDILLTDVVMPQMGGKDLADYLLQIRPGISVLFTSGYPGNIDVQLEDPERGVEFMEKPFSPEDLAHRVRQVLDRRRSP